jgi:hypothetical protein
MTDNVKADWWAITLALHEAEAAIAWALRMVKAAEEAAAAPQEPEEEAVSDAV